MLRKLVTTCTHKLNFFPRKGNFAHFSPSRIIRPWPGDIDFQVPFAYVRLTQENNPTITEKSLDSIYLHPMDNTRAATVWWI
jgi:hypothetical protein